MENNSHKKQKKRKLQVSQQGTTYELNPYKQIKKEPDDETHIEMYPGEDYKSSIKSEFNNSIPDNDADEVMYFKKILDTLKTGVPDESRDLIVSNALEECRGKEIELSCHPIIGRCIELLLSFCTDTSIWDQFLLAFAIDMETVCTNPSASHIVELLNQFALKNMINWSSVRGTNTEEETVVSVSLNHIEDYGNFVAKNFSNCLQDKCAAHIATSVIRALGGDMPSDYMSKKLNKFKKEFSLNSTDETSSNNTFFKEEIILEDIPIEFKDKLLQISNNVRRMEHLSDYISESYGAMVIETLICILDKRIPKQCRKLIRFLAVELFYDRDKNGVPIAFLKKNISFVVEKMFEAGNEKLQTQLWQEYIAENLEHLITHHISNFIIQRFFDFIKSPALLRVMSEKAGSFFDKILEAERFGIFLSIASACNRLQIQQALFMKNIMECVECLEPPERQLKLVPLLLGLCKYDDSEYVKNSELSIRLQGSLLIQSLLSFQKPIKLVNSLLDMKPQSLIALACHLQGCHVITSFFKSDTVGEKSKDKLVQKLQPFISYIACDENGNLTLSRIWVLLSLKQKGAIATALAHDEDKLKSSRRGNVIFNKFRVFQYKRNFEQWKDFQQKFSNKKGEKCK